MTMSPILLIFLALFGVVYSVAAGRASAARKRQLWSDLKAGKPSAIAIVVLVAAFAAYIMLSYESPN